MRDEAMPLAWKFHTPVARLYSFIGKENAVRTPDGIGTLMKAHSCPGGCQVQLMREKERTKQKPHDQVMREYDVNQVEAIGGEA